MIWQYLSDIISDYKPKNLRVNSKNEVIDYETQFREWKIQLTISINDIIDELFESFLQKYHKGSMRRSDFSFDIVDLLYYNLQKISLNRKGSSYIDSPK